MAAWKSITFYVPISIAAVCILPAVLSQGLISVFQFGHHPLSSLQWWLWPSHICWDCTVVSQLPVSIPGCGFGTAYCAGTVLLPCLYLVISSVLRKVKGDWVPGTQIIRPFLPQPLYAIAMYPFLQKVYTEHPLCASHYTTSEKIIVSKDLLSSSGLYSSEKDRHKSPLTIKSPLW